MKLARSTYYYRARRAAAREMALHERIINLCEEFPRYGYRRVTQQLRAEGVLINHKKVTRIMQEHSPCRCGLCAASCAPPAAIMLIRYFLIWPQPSVPQDLTSCGSPI